MKNDTEQTRLIMNSTNRGDDIETQYPTDEELEYMYEEYIKSGSFEDIFGIKESKDTEFPF